eukprot:2840920-Pleurochrysis_carterae.AAC.1
MSNSPTKPQYICWRGRLGHIIAPHARARPRLSGVGGCWPAPPYLTFVWRRRSQLVRMRY